MFIEAGGCGDRAGRGGMTGAVWVDIMKEVLKLPGLDIS